MIKNSTLYIGGNSVKEFIGKFISVIGKMLVEYGDTLVKHSQPILVTNPSAKLYNPFTLIITFTVGSADKYQLILQGDYKERYKAAIEIMPGIDENELFMIINQHQKEWFKKD